jgi:hypothetical protein
VFAVQWGRKNTCFNGPGKGLVKSKIVAAWSAIGPFLQDSLVDFFAVYLDIRRRFNADAYLITFYAKYRYGDIITNDKLFPDPSCQNQHANLPLVWGASCTR